MVRVALTKLTQRDPAKFKAEAAGSRSPRIAVHGFIEDGTGSGARFLEAEPEKTGVTKDVVDELAALSDLG